MVVVFVLIGLALVVVGFLIWKLQIVGIIAGYDETRTKDKAGLARWVGANRPGEIRTHLKQCAFHGAQGDQS